LITGLKAVLAGAAMAVAMAFAAVAQQAPDRAAVENIVRDYLLANPEIIVEAMGVLRERERVAEETRSRAAVASNYDALALSPNDPVAGDPDGDVVIVEFFDYRCPYCKRVLDPLIKAVEEDGNIRLVFKEYPILGPESVLAARAALASQKQEKYREFHIALMSVEGPLNEANILNVAESIGLDTGQLQSDMSDPAIQRQIAANYGLANNLGIKGTPAFVIGREIVPGAITMEEMKSYIARARDES
jgi:protein-disulfide isomerase